ncbi:MAG: hypothetical protein FWF29_03485 [Treponema sp.]|nr:hypothetical protein [Treponema sp.]
MENNLPEIDKSQLYYGKVVLVITIVACVISLVAPVLILMFPHKNLLNPAVIFNAIFNGSKPSDIWAAAGVPLETNNFWKLFFSHFFTPDGFGTLGIILGCSVTLWALIPAVWQFIRKKEYYYVGVSLFVMALIVFAMSGIINMAG